MATDLRNIILSELSLVDAPANKDSRVTIFKRADPVAEEIVKRWIDPADGAKSFSEFLQSSMDSDRYYQVMEEVGPLIGALDGSLRSVLADKSLTSEARNSMVRSSVDGFLVAIQEKSSDVEAAIAKVFTGPQGPNAGDHAGDHIGEKEKSMSDDAKKVADLEKQVADLTTNLEKASADLEEANVIAKMSDGERAHMASLKDAKAKADFMAMSAADRAKAINKAAADDEVIKVDDAEIRKSEVGAAQFAVIKSQQERIAKQDEDIAKERDTRVTAELRKRADDEFGHVPGSIEERTAMLKAISGMDEAVSKSFIAVFKQSEELAKKAFDTVGHRGGSDLNKSAIDAFNGKVAEIQKRDNIDRFKALSIAAREHPDLHQAYSDA